MIHVVHEPRIPFYSSLDSIVGRTEIAMTTPPAEKKEPEPTYGGYTRFELELEACSYFFPCASSLDHLLTFLGQFVQSLGNPYYLNHLASQKLLQDPSFIAYLRYLLYFTKPEYTKYILYPGPTLRALELLQHERFRQDILSPETVAKLAEGMVISSINRK